MGVGHYGVSFAAKRLAPGVPLWVLFVAVQALDVLWASFLLLGIEHARIVPGITASNPFDLYHMPYTHSLVAAVGWSVATLAVCRLWGVGRPFGTAALVIALAVLSHWFADLLVHRPDLPLYGDRAKVGLGLWNQPAAGLGLEAGLLFGGMWLYFAGGAASRTHMVVFGLAMLTVQVAVFFGPPLPSETALGLVALASYGAFAALVSRVEKSGRAPSP